MIIVSDKGHRETFSVLATNSTTDIHALAVSDGFQCFPFYVYDEDGTNRRENITDWALAQFVAQYGPDVTKWDIFHAIYALLHAPDYRARYAQDLKRDLPHIPFVPAADWPAFVSAGQRLAALHVGYEAAALFPLRHIENRSVPWTWRVERLRYSADKSAVIVNDALTLVGVPLAAHQYRLGNRSALEWVIDQYRITTDKRSGIVSDPNDPADPQRIVRLIKQVITVSVQTVQIIASLPKTSSE